jgi:hypothetical protein
MLTLDELREAYIATGLPCEWVVTENDMSGSCESGVCRNSENGLNIFATPSASSALDRLRAASTLLTDEPRRSVPR